ncbi:hypothetical protein SAMN04489732_12089 [Amycolatopsis saalfeldensis]|uniref:Uncharacterized protein n=1 Tax=Amycolatopsis saalfeldensis TaxID=394193 RepID=A0A1H8YJU5_9PSEU|nr:hypothetical protein SAMN04489732_12089 [Amycolatopsis saalfeldensis]
MFVLGCQVVISAPPAFADDCGQAPNPQRPGAGLVGTIDTPGLTSDPSPYDTYGYAGMVWHTFHTNCRGPLASLSDPTGDLATDAGNFLFNGAKLLVASTNGLHHAVTDSTLLGPIYRAVQSGANKVYTNIYTQLLALCALLLSLIVLRSVWRGDLATVSKRALYGLAALWLAASSVVLLRYLEPFDHAVVGFTTDIQNGFIPDSDRDPAADAFPRQLHNQIIYQNWLRGEFGAPTAPQADQFGRPLLDAQAFSVAELVNGDDAKVSVIDAKKQSYIDISGKLGPATDSFTGERGGRIGAGLLALLESVTYALFPFLAALTVLLAQVILRLLIITSPLLGLMALLHPGLLRTLAKVAGIVGFNLLVVSTLAGVHSLLLQAVFAANMPVMAQLGIAGITTALIWGAARPLRRLSQTLKAPARALSRTLSYSSNGVLHGGQQVAAQERFWNQVRDSISNRELQTLKSTRSRPEGNNRPAEAFKREAISSFRPLVSSMLNQEADGSSGARSTDTISGNYTHAVGWTGGGRLLEAGDTPKAFAAYERIRNSPEDIPIIAKNTGLNAEVLEEAWQNLFVRKHDIPDGPGLEKVRYDHFVPNVAFSNLWDWAARDNLDSEEYNQFRSLMAHEYVESRLMQETGIPYLSPEPSTWDETGPVWDPKNPSAHMIAPLGEQSNPETDLLRHWKKQGLTPPPGGISQDLSNLDDVVQAAREGLGL